MTQLQYSPELAAVVIQKFFRANRSRSSTKKLWKKLNQRKKIIQELVITEEKYIHDLSIIISDFQIYLFNSKIITPTQIYVLFSNVDAIRKLNQHFFVVLHNGFNSYWHYKILFEEVKSQISFFKIYFEYLNNFTQSMGLMKELKQNNSKFKGFLLEIKKNNRYNNLDLEDYLIKPVQRLPKYVLLLKLLLKKTPNDHPDYENIKKVLECFEEVNSSNNEKLNKLINNFKLTELQKQAKLPFHITEPGTQFIIEETITILTSQNKAQDAVMYLLNNRVILTKRTKNQQKFLETVNFKYGAMIIQNEDQQLYENCFTLQSIDGESVTFIFQNQQEMTNIKQKIQEQIKLIEKKNLQKYSALQSQNQASESFIKNITRFDLMPEVLVIGTQQRTDKMLKYTTYIVEVKIKNVKQKIFLRYSELLQLQQIIPQEFPHLSIKQTLYKTTWLLNHKPKTIEQRKMSIQRFLTELLSKPEIIQCGRNVLNKLGLPQDLYQIPDKVKTNESFIRKSGIGLCKPMRSELETNDKQGLTSHTGLRKTRKTYRLSIFQDLSDQEDKAPRNHSMNQNLGLSKNTRRLNIEEMLYANQLNLGHYIRYSENIQGLDKNKIKVQIQIPWIQHPKGIVKRIVQIAENQRVSVLVNKLVKQIGLNYYKDFRLFLQKQYAQRVLDDDEIIMKVQKELITGKFTLIFKKMIYIDKYSEENEIKADTLRLKLIASQIIHDVRKSKYRLKYNTFLTLSVLIGIIQHEIKLANEENIQNLEQPDDSRRFIIRSIKSDSQMRATFKKAKTSIEPEYKSLALSTRQLLASPYSSFFENDKVWIKDFTETYKNLHMKLKKIARGNSMLIRSSLYSQEEEQIWTSVVELSYIGIIDEVKENHLFGSMSYVVQISEQFRKILIEGVQDRQDDSGDFDIETKENRNIWLIVKSSSISLYSINLQVKLQEFSYTDIDKILCYPSSIIIFFKDLLCSKINPSYLPQNYFLTEKTEEQKVGDHYNLEKTHSKKQSKRKSQYQMNKSQERRITIIQNKNQKLLPEFIKLKTTNSYSIRQLINYYKNFNELSQKIKDNQTFTDSIIEMIYENERTNQHHKTISFIDSTEENLI